MSNEEAEAAAQEALNTLARKVAVDLSRQSDIYEQLESAPVEIQLLASETAKHIEVADNPKAYVMAGIAAGMVFQREITQRMLDIIKSSCDCGNCGGNNDGE